MDAIGGYHVKSCKLGSERQRLHVLSQKWKIDPKEKHIYKNKHDNVQTHM
jgi:hypothetical protein